MLSFLCFGIPLFPCQPFFFVPSYLFLFSRSIVCSLLCGLLFMLLLITGSRNSRQFGF